MITINKTDKFFIAVCATQNKHSFLTVGVQRSNGETEMLLDVGKAIPLSNNRERPSSVTCRIACGGVHADIINHELLAAGKQDNFERKITYMAFEMSYMHYLQMLAALRVLNRTITAYIPVAETETTISFDYRPLETFSECSNETSPTLEHLEKNMDHITVRDHCRTAALELASIALGKLAQTSPFLPSFPFWPFSCKNSIMNSRLTQPLFILPPPPDAYHTDMHTQKVLSRLYQRLGESVLIHQDSKETREKFDNIRELYTSLTAAEAQPSLEDLLKSVVNWAEKNKASVDHHRWFHFPWQKTATRKMVNEIAADINAASVASLKPVKN